MPKKLLLIIAALLISITSGNAQTVFGKYAGEFMAIGVGGRALGMGGAFTGVANDFFSNLFGIPIGRFGRFYRGIFCNRKFLGLTVNGT